MPNFTASVTEILESFIVELNPGIIIIRVFSVFTTTLTLRKPHTVNGFSSFRNSPISLTSRLPFTSKHRYSGPHVSGPRKEQAPIVFSPKRVLVAIFEQINLLHDCPRHLIRDFCCRTFILHSDDERILSDPFNFYVSYFLPRSAENISNPPFVEIFVDQSLPY